MKDSFEVYGMMCVKNCAVKVKEAALSVDGVESANVNFLQNTLHVTYKADMIEAEIHDGVALAVQSAGYDVKWDGMKNLLYVKIDGMTCDHCVKTVRKAISSLEGVQHVAVNLEQKIAVIVMDPSVTSNVAFCHTIVETVEDVGFGAEVYSGSSRDISIPVANLVVTSNFETANKGVVERKTTPELTATTAADDEVLNSFRAISGVACVQLRADPTSQKGSLNYVIRGTASFDDIVSVAQQAGVSLHMDSFEVSGMMCVNNCAVKVKEAALSVEGVHSAEVNFENRVLHIIYSNIDLASEIHDGVAVAVQSAGYDVEWTGKNNLLHVKVDGMFCGHCVKTVRKAISSLKGVRHVAVNLEQRIAAIAIDPDAPSPDALYSSILNTIEEVGFGAEVYRGNRDITIQVTRNDSNKFDSGESNERITIGQRMADGFLNPLRTLAGVACVQLKEGQSLAGADSDSPSRPLEILIRGTVSYEEVLASSKFEGWEILLTSIAYDHTFEGWQSKLYHQIPSAGSASSADGGLIMKRGAALLMEEASVVSDILQTSGSNQVVAYSDDAVPTRSVFSVKGMSCGACVAAVERVLRKHECVTKVAVALLTEKVEVQYNSALLTSDDIIQDIVKAGYEAALINTSTGSTNVTRQILITALTPTKNVDMVSDFNDVILALQEMEGVLGVAWLQGGDLQRVLQDAQDHINEANVTGPGASPAAISNCALVLEFTFDSSVLGLRTVFDAVGENHENYVSIILPAKGEGSDIFEKQKIALKKLEMSFYFALAFTLPLAVVMWSGALMHVMVVPGLSASALIVAVLATPVQFISGARFYREAFRGIKVGTYGMGLLIALGTSFAYFFGVYSLIMSIVSEGDVEAYPDHIMTAAMLVTFMLLGKVMEIRAKLRTSSALKTLMDRQPKSAILMNPLFLNLSEEDVLAAEAAGVEREREIPIELIQQNDVVKVIRGMSVPADGEVLFGYGEVNEALITGEALPVNKTIGSAVIGGTVLQDGVLHVIVKASPENSMLQQIILLVEGAQMQKAPIQQIADAIAGVFTIIIVSLACIVFILWMSLLETNSIRDKHIPAGMSNFNVAFTLAVSTLVVACPCAMGLATPTAIMVGTGVGAKFGVLIKGGEALENANKITTVVFDKTGTLTVGCPSVTGVYVLSNSGAPYVKLYEGCDVSTTGNVFCIEAEGAIDREIKEKTSSSDSSDFVDFVQMMWLTGCAEVSSEHVLGRAIVQHATGVSAVQALREPEEMKAVTGKGVECVIGGVKVLIGSLSFLQEENSKHSDNNDFIALAENIQSTGAIVIFVALDGVMCCFMQLSDSARPESKETVKALQDRGIAVWMVTGDNFRTANSMGAVVGIPVDHIIAGALPNTKIDHVKKLQEKEVVGFVGDGINDAPALAQADVGLAVGGGTDVAMESADMVLMRADLFSVVVAIDLSHAILRCIRRNLFWALAYNVMAIPMAAGLSLVVFKAILPPWVAGGAMALSSVSVVMSSLTLSLYSPPTMRDVPPSS